MNEEAKKNIIYELNLKLGTDLNNFDRIYDIRSELLQQKNELEKSLSLANSEVPSKVSAAIARAEATSEKIRMYQEKEKRLRLENDEFFAKMEPVTEKLSDLLHKVRQLEATKEYLESLETVNRISQDLKRCTDSEQSVLLLQTLYDLRELYNEGHRGTFISETTHYWYDVLREKFSKEFEEVLKLIRWPFTATTLSLTNPVSPETMGKFRQLSQYLLQIQMPAEIFSSQSVNQEISETTLCLPIRLLLKPLKKRFTFHFSGNRRTNRPDRPEWFLTQILSWLRDHQPFLAQHLQPVVDGLDINIDVQNEFLCGLMQLGVERLHALLATVATDDALFSHAVDEALGMERELANLQGSPLPTNCPRLTGVLTDARYFVRWLAVEKKFAIQKIDEMLSGPEWLQSLGGGEESEVMPQGADWLISLLQTVHDRYSLLPQPGYRLQFLELQMELCEELRVRLTQLLGEELREGNAGGGGEVGSSALLAMLNVTHRLRQALLDWAQSVPYLQLHYYKRQFQYFTELQHMPIPDIETTPQKPTTSSNFSKPDEGTTVIDKDDNLHRPSISLKEVEVEAQQLAQIQVQHLKHDIMPSEIVQSDIDNQNLNIEEESDPEAGVFEEVPGLLGRLVDGTCSLLCDDLVLEVKAASRDYRNQKWHCLPEQDWRCRWLSPALCAPLGALGARLLRLKGSLAADLFGPLWRAVAREIDMLIFEEVVVECWWGPGGAQQFQFDMTRNLMAIFAQYSPVPEAHLPRIKESCILLLLPLGSAILLREALQEAAAGAPGVSVDCAPNALAELNIRHLTIEDARRVLSQRTDLSIHQ